ncbi:MAG: hypothetical protein N5P05_000901 [Chroococcopsis gigantea SAG 12.99]|jgi:adenylate cyclase|nr:CHASE2 domain-containing protein [Chlorogloea purpurea SAG 13.99]MDV2999295.1 hypothetical protein [Chroococcopsis gigantea SAG 12.99]
MTSNVGDYEYQVGGSLSQDARSYVLRSADGEFYQYLKRGEFCYVLNSRQMGKSSLRVRTMQKLGREGIRCGFIDLSGIGTEDVTPQKWYAGMVQMLVKSCGIAYPWRDWWRERRDLLSPIQCFSEFIDEIVLKQIPDNIVIFIDEIDHVLGQNFCPDEFFAMLRFCWQQRNNNPDYQRLTFALLGVASPSTLIKNKAHTPFNIGHAIELKGFQEHEVYPLSQGLKIKSDSPEELMRQILYYTGGQPFLTQKICRLIINNPGNLSLEQIVPKYIIENWESQDEPEHLRTIRDRLLLDSQQSNRLLGLYLQILQRRSIESDNSTEQQILRLSGVVTERNGGLEVYNPIYDRIFNEAWVRQQLGRLRPYNTEISLWLASGGQDTACLLTGESLQAALSWSLGKSLGNEDYQFLNASQESAKREVERTLTATQQASHFLARARRQAEEDTGKYRLNPRMLAITSLLVWGLIISLCLGGLLQGWELNTYDRFLRLRPLEATESRIAVVTIDEQDIEFLQQWPPSDRTLTRLLQTIKEGQPRVIGLDIYRNLTIDPGKEELIQISRSTPYLYGIEKIVPPRIAPPPVLNGEERVGFADQILDLDGKVRRALLTVVAEESKLKESLAVRLAGHYLAAENIQPQAQGKERLQWGKAIFTRFQGNDGGYVRADDGGYQILINFRGGSRQFASIPLRDVLNRSFDKESFRDRIVLIGAIAESLNDFFLTPYSGGSGHFSPRLPGVYLHANIVSQLLSAVIDGRGLIRTPDKIAESCFILAWGAIGGSIGWWFKKIGSLLVAYCLNLSLLLWVCYFAFGQGLWLPLIPSVLAGGITLTLMVILTARSVQQRYFIKTLILLGEIGRHYPRALRIAVESLKNSVGKRQLSLIKSYFPDF